ncbi:MAG: hypothetical protein ABIS92_01555 [Polyangia bacterium]
MRAQPPTYRPTWVLVMASVMLMAGGYSLVAGLLKLRDPSIVLTVANSDPSGSDADVQLNRQLLAARAAAVAPHRNMVRAEALFEVGLALFTLYATAAVLLRDRNGRALTLGVGALGIAYQLGTLPVYMSLMRDYAERGADLLAQVVIQSAAGTVPPDPAEVARRLRAAIVGGPVVVTILSVAGSIVLLAFFGGRRGRALYGIDGPPSTRPGI